MDDLSIVVGVIITLIVVGAMVVLVNKSRRKGKGKGGPSYQDLNPPPGNQQER